MIRSMVQRVEDEHDEMAIALARIDRSISFVDGPQEFIDPAAPKGLHPKRVMAAVLPPGARFRCNEVNIIQVPYEEGREEIAKRELMRQAGMGVTYRYTMTKRDRAKVEFNRREIAKKNKSQF